MMASGACKIRQLIKLLGNYDVITYFIPMEHLRLKAMMGKAKV